MLWLFQGNLRPEEALQALTIYEGKFGRLKDDREKCAKAKEALELTDTGLLSGSEERVQVWTCEWKVWSTALPHTAAVLGQPNDPARCSGGFSLVSDSRAAFMFQVNCLAFSITGGSGGVTGPQRSVVRAF